MAHWLKIHHTAVIRTAIILLIVLLLALNILFAWLQQYKALYIDLTPEGLYTLSSNMIDTCAQLKGEITITFCQEPDYLLAYNDSRYVYVMCMELANKFDNITVETYDITQNPTAVNKFKDTSATTIGYLDMIVSCGSRYRITSCAAFWTLSEDATDTSTYYSFNGEFKLASILLSVTSVINPVVCVAYSHGEKIYVPENVTVDDSIRALSCDDYATFYKIFQVEGLTLQYIDLDTESIPEDCILLVMNGPTTDYSYGDLHSALEETPLRKLQTFLAKDFRSMLFFKDPDVSLPNMEAFSADWGIAFDNDIYVREDAAHSIDDGTGKNQKIIATLSDDEYSSANAVYQYIAALATAPRTIVENSGAVHKAWINDYIATSTTQNYNAYYFEFLMSSENAMAYTTDGLLDTEEKQTYTLAALTFKRLQDTDEDVRYYSYYFGAHTTELTTNTYLENMAYGNYDVLYALIRYISRTDEFASMDLGGLSLNSPTPGGKVLVTETLTESTGNVKYDEEGLEAGYYEVATDEKSLTTILLLTIIPITLGLILGFFVLIRRKNK